MINATEKETREGSKHDTRQSTNHKRRQKQKKEFLKEIKKRTIIINKMALRTYIWIIILNINGIY